MRLVNSGITITVNSPSEIERYKSAGYVEVVEEKAVEEVPAIEEKPKK